MTTDVERGVQDYLSHLSVERGLAANTLHSYRRDLRRYLEFLGSRDLADPATITENDIVAFLGSLRTGSTDHVSLGTASAARTIVAVRGLHRFLLREQVVPTDVTSAIKPPRPASRLPKALPLSDIEAILEAAGAPGTTLSSRDRALLEVLYGTGRASPRQSASTSTTWIWRSRRCSCGARAASSASSPWGRTHDSRCWTI